ncbi:MAG: glutamate racemase [Campylobacteraceae bacterium]|nr:glutamate racemase [Campylobacteraceae bacterium]
MKVGVFDSGIGGLTVVKSLLEQKLFEEIIYYGDTARVPYGAKDKNTIIRYSLEALEFFKNFDLDIVIIACNTASAYAISELREVSDIPVIGVIEPGVMACSQTITDRNANILVLGTKATIGSKKYETSLKEMGYTNLKSIPTGLFVPIVEEGIFEGKVLNSALTHYLEDLKDIDAVILGCTHFPFIQENISQYLGGCITIHSGDAIVRYLKDEHNYDKNFKETKVTFFASENPDNLKNIAKKWLGSLLND